MLSFEDAKVELANLISRIEACDLPKVPSFVSDCIDSLTIEMPERIHGLKTLRRIAKSFRQEVGINGEITNEKIIWPVDGEFKDSRAGSIVDAFLYDDMDMEELQNKGLVCPERFCRDCNSTNVQETVYSSHSLSIEELDSIFNEVLPKFTDSTDKCLVDIGSRLGVVLYSAILFRPEVKAVYGIELNSEFCDLQRKALKNNGMTDKCFILEGDFRNNLDSIRNADIIFMNNVFTFFADPETQSNCWKILRRTFSSGSLLVHLHSVQSITSHLDLGFDIDDWLELLYPTTDSSEDAPDYNIYLYKIR